MSGIERIPDPDRRPAWARSVVPRLGLRPVKPPRSAVRLVQRLAGCEREDARRWCASLAVRRTGRYWLMVLAAMAAVGVWLWIAAFGVLGLSLPLNAAYELIERHHGTGGLGLALSIALTLAVWVLAPVAITGVTEGLLWRAPLRRDAAECVAVPLCMTCGYDCRHLAAQPGREVRCPECGVQTPKRPAPAE